MKNGYKFHVQFHINNVCNLRCKHCYEGNPLSHTSWDFESFKVAIDKLWNCFAKWHVKGEISIIGGEPLLHPDIERIIEYLGNRSDIFTISILTNGLLINKKTIELIRLYKCHVQVSIDGVDSTQHDYIRGAGNYQKLISKINMLVEAGIFPSVHYVLSRNTTPLNKQFFDDLIDVGIKQLTFSRLVPFGSATKQDMLSATETKEVYEHIYNTIDYCAERGLHIVNTRPLWSIFGFEGKCPVAIQTITILENGDIVPCRRLPIVIGNIMTDNFFDVWYTSPILNDLRDRQRINKCGTCNMRDNCGGARCVAYGYYGDYMKEDPQCWI